MGNFCTNCGFEIRKDDKFCTNCGTKIRKDNEICTNCGSEIRKDDKYCTNCGTKIDKSYVKPDNKLSKSKQNRIKKESKKEEKSKLLEAMTSRKIENNMTNGIYCDLNCIHCLEEFLDSAGGVDGDFSNDGYFEYYCTLNHPLVFGKFCEYYESR